MPKTKNHLIHNQPFELWSQKFNMKKVLNKTKAIYNLTQSV